MVAEPRCWRPVAHLALNHGLSLAGAFGTTAFLGGQRLLDRGGEASEAAGRSGASFSTSRSGTCCSSRREAGSQVDMEELMESGGSSGAERCGSLEPGSSLAAGQPAGECPAGGASEATAQDIIAPATSLHAAAVLEMSPIREEEDSSAEGPWQHSGPWLEASRHRRGVGRDRQSWWSSSDDDAKYWENWWTWPTVENYVVQNYPAENYEDQSSERHSVQSDWSDESFGHNSNWSWWSSRKQWNVEDLQGQQEDDAVLRHLQDAALHAGQGHRYGGGHHDRALAQQGVCELDDHGRGHGDDHGRARRDELETSVVSPTAAAVKDKDSLPAGEAPRGVTAVAGGCFLLGGCRGEVELLMPSNLLRSSG